MLQTGEDKCYCREYYDSKNKKDFWILKNNIIGAAA